MALSEIRSSLMDVQSIIDIAVGAALAVAGWFGRQIWEAVNDLREDLHKIEIQLPENYVRKDEFTDVVKEIRTDIKTGFEKVLDKLDGKQDKPHHSR